MQNRRFATIDDRLRRWTSPDAEYIAAQQFDLDRNTFVRRQFDLIFARYERRDIADFFGKAILPIQRSSDGDTHD
jgi:hypothetical protein